MGANDVPQRLEPLIVALIGPLACGLVLCLLLASPYNHDEEQYVAAGAAALHGVVYRDFVYLQTPVYPMILAAAFSIARGDIYLAAHVVSALATLGCCGLVYAVLRTLGCSRSSAGFGGLALLFSTTVQLAASSGRNDAAPLLLFLAGLLAAVRAWSGPSQTPPASRYVLLGAAGLALGLSVSTKLTYVFAAPVLGAYVLVQDRPWRAPRALAQGAVVGIGGLMGLSPTVAALAAFPVQAAYGMFRYHLTAPIYFYTATGRAHELTLPSKLAFAAKLFRLDAVLVSCLAIFALALWRRWAERGRRPFLAPGPPILALFKALLLGALVMAILPSPPQQQYWMAPIAIAIVLAAALTAELRGRLPAWLLVVAWLPGALGGAHALSRLAPTLSRPQTWTAVKVMRASRAIATAQRQAHDPGPIATLAPIYVLDAGGRILPELVSGPFVFRSGPTLSPDRLRTLHALSPTTLAADLDARRVAGVYVGHERSFLKGRVSPDGLLEAYARARRFVQAPAPVDGTLFLRPAPHAPAAE